MDKNGYYEEAFASFGNALANACRMFGQALDCFIENFPKALRLAIPRAVEIAMEDPAMLKRWAKENDRELYRKIKLAKKPRTKEKLLLQVAAEYCLKGTDQKKG